MKEQRRLYYLTETEAEIIDSYRKRHQNNDQLPAADQEYSAVLPDSGSDIDNQLAAEKAREDADQHLSDDDLDEQHKLHNPLDPYKLSSFIGRAAGSIVDGLKDGYQSRQKHE